MAKPPVTVHVQSSDFKKLLELQAESVQQLSTVRSILEKEGTGPESPQRIQIDILGQLQEQLKVQRKTYKLQEDFQKEWNQESKDIAELAQGLASVKSVADRITDFGSGIKKMFDPSGWKEKIKSSMNIGGVLDKSIARDKFVEKQRLLGSTASTKDLHADFEEAHKTAKQISKGEAELKTIKEKTGMQSEDDLRMYSPRAKEILEKRQELTDVYGRYDRGTYQHSPTPVSPLTPAGEAMSRGMSPVPVATQAQQNKDVEHDERTIETDRKSEQNTKLLEQIAQNTGGKPGQTNVKAEPAGEGGLMGKIGAGLKDLGGGMKALGAGVGKGIQAVLTGIANGIKAFGNMDVLKGALVMGVLGGSIWIMGKALEQFQDLEWESIAKGLVAVAGFGALAAIMGTAAPLLMTGALAIGAIGVALVPFGIAMKLAGEGMNQLADGLTKLDAISGDNLLKVAEGLVAIGGAMAVFAAGQAAMGLSNLVTGFLGFVSGQKTPVDQMTQMAAAGDGLVKAGDGIKQIADGMAAFAKISPEQMKAVNEFPWLKATAFAAVGGAMRVSTGEQSVEVYTKSAKNQEEAMANQTAGGGGNTSIIAPTTNNTSKTTQNIQLPVRNQEQSMNRYMHNKFAF